MKSKVLSIALGGVAATALLGTGVTAYAQSVSAAAAVTKVKVAVKADNFRLVDQHSKAHELHYYKNSPAIVIVAQQNGAQTLRSAAPAIKALQQTYAARDVPILLLNSTPADN